MILLRLSGEVIIAEILLAMAQIALPGYEIRRWHTTLLLEGVAVLSAVYAIFASRILAKTNLVARESPLLSTPWSP